MKCITLQPNQRLGAIPRDAHVKKDVAYLLIDRLKESCVLAFSLPLLAKWVNDNICAGGKVWDCVSVTGLFDNLNRLHDEGRTNGWHKGRFRVQSMPLDEARDAFDAARHQHTHAAVIGHKIMVRQ